MLSCYAGVGNICPSFNVSVVSGGNLTGSGSLYFSFQLQNRAGFNIPSVSSQINYTTGQKIIITIPDTVKKDGWDIHNYQISAGATNNPANHVPICRIPGYELSPDPQTVEITLPVSIELTKNSHIALAPTVANIAALPTGSDRLDGQVRWVSDISQWVEYRVDDLPYEGNVYPADIGQWVRVQSASTYISDTANPGGSDRPLVYNDDSVSLTEGTEFGIVTEYNGLNSPELLSGLFMVEFQGYVNVSTGALRTTKIADNTTFYNVGGYVPWTPKLTTPFLAPDDLLPGEAIQIAVKPFFSAAELAFFQDYRNSSTGMVNGDIIGVKPTVKTRSGDYNPLGKLLYIEGNEARKGVVYNIGDQYRVVPDIGLNYKVLSGCAVVNSIDFPKKPARVFSGLLPETENQKIIINGNGNVFTEQDDYVIQSSEALRAIVGTIMM